MRDSSNILLITTDQHRLDSLGAYGNQTIRTPYIDRLATSGTIFTQAFTPTAICTPARASLLTGVNPHKHKLLANFERNVGYQEELSLSDQVVPFSGPLLDAGYAVENIGKWHIGKQQGPEAFGFAGPHFQGWGEPLLHPDYLRYLDDHGLPRFEPSTQVRGRFPNGRMGNIIAGVYDGPEEGTFSYYLADQTIQRLQVHAQRPATQQKPFFIACQFFGPHLPYHIPEGDFYRYNSDDVQLNASHFETFAAKPQVQQNYSRHWATDQYTEQELRQLTAIYWGYVSLIDRQIGRILSALELSGLAQRTVVIFTSDHGAFVGAHRLQDKGPAMYDDIYRIPLILKQPEAETGSVCGSFVSLIDIAPTVLELAGADVPAAYQGTSLLRVLNGDSSRPYITAEFHGHHFPYAQRMIRTLKHKLVINPADIDELYDLESDPYEVNNVIDHPLLQTVRTELCRDLYRQLQSEGDNFYHWMTSMYPVMDIEVDASLSQLNT